VRALTALVLACICSIALAAQAVPPNGPPGGPWPDAQAFLGLSYEQMLQLRRLQSALPDELAPLVENQRKIQRAIEQEMQSDAPDPTALGNLMLRSREAARQVEELRAGMRRRAVEALTPEQQAKLEQLRVARSLELAAHQAINLNLIGENERPRGPGQ